MAGKLRAAERRTKWCESGTRFSASYLDQVNTCLSSDSPPPLRTLASELLALSRVQHTYGELEGVQRVLEAFHAAAAPPATAPPAPTNKAAGPPPASAPTARAVDAGCEVAKAAAGDAQQPPPALAAAAHLLAGLLFQDGSLPLHRTIMAAVKRLPPTQQCAFGAAVTAHVRATLAELDAASPLLPLVHDLGARSFASATAPAAPTGVPLGPLVASLLWLPAAHAWVQPVVAELLARLAAGVDAVLRAADVGSLHVAPALMQEVQDTIGALYNLLQQHGRQLAGAEPTSGGGAAREAAVRVGLAMLRALQGRALVREALASAAVVLWAAALLPAVAPGAVAAAIGQGLFIPAPPAQGGDSGGSGPPAGVPAATPVLAYKDEGSTGVPSGSAPEPPAGWLDRFLHQARGSGQGSSLVAELRRLSAIGRICSLKGLVTAMPHDALCAPIAYYEDRQHASPSPVPWHFLVDGALKFGCTSIRDAPDAHFKFHAACVLCFCMAKVLESWQQHPERSGAAAVHDDDGDRGAPADPGTPPRGGPLVPPIIQQHSVDMLTGLVLANLEEPLAQTARQLHETFQLLLDVLACQDRFAPGVLPPFENYKLQVMRQLLSVSYNCKGRYAPLASLAERGAALAIVIERPQLITEALMAMQTDTTAAAASAFLKTLLASARTEASARPQQAAEAAAAAARVGGAGSSVACDSPWLALWRGAVLGALYSANDKQRAYASVYALPVVLGLDPSAALDLIHATLNDLEPEPVPGTSRVAALVAILKAARGMGLVGDLDALVAAAGTQRLAVDPECLLAAAVVHASEAVRLDVLELACVSYRMSDAPGKLELLLAGRWLLLCMRGTALGQRNKTLVLVTKLLARIRMAVSHIHHKLGTRRGPAHPSNTKGRGLQVLFGQSDAAETPGEAQARDLAALGRMQAFMQWTTQLLVSGMYPGAPYERRFFVLELLSAVLEAWAEGSPAAAAPGRATGSTSRGGRMAESTSLSLLPRGCQTSSAALGGENVPTFRPYCAELLSPNTVSLLLAGAVDSWDKLRQAASSCLMRLPTPLPGLETSEQLSPLLSWAAGLLWSPRMRESDAGARLVKILFAKYVVERGWRLTLSPVPTGLPPTALNTAGADSAAGAHAAVLPFLDSVVDLVASQVEAARADLLTCCRRSLVHGPLLLLRYVVEDVPWAALQSSGSAGVMASWAARVLAVLDGVIELALPILSAPQDMNVGAEEVAQGEADDGGSDAGSSSGSDAEEGLGPDSQVILTACWTSAKEVALVLGTMVRYMPLPSAGATEREGDGGGRADALVQPVLPVAALQRIGAVLLRLMFEMKHNGAVEKSSLALSVVAERLLRAPVQDLNVLPRPWLEACIVRVLAPSQSRNDIVRRSSGLPFAFGALFRAEPGNAPKALLARAVTALLAVAGAACSPALTARCEEAVGDAADGGGSSVGAAPVLEVEGYPLRQVWPVVHAFNCLRHAFNDSNLAIDMSGFVGRAIQACLEAMRSGTWEIRNAATLCFTALTTRVLGFKNDSRIESGKKAVSGVEFFERYPQLHVFLLEQLREATSDLQRAGSSAAALAQPHPGLYPVLTILSRLKPSLVRECPDGAVPDQQQGGGPLAPVGTFMGAPGSAVAAFVPLVRQCATAAPLAVRRLAARALSPLLAAQDVPAVIQQLLSAVPPAPQPTHAGARPHHVVQLQLGCNALHGSLLQAAALLRSLGDGSSDASLVEDALCAALPALARGSWLADPQHGCSSLGDALLEASAAALQLLPQGRCAQSRSEIAAIAEACRNAVSYAPPERPQQPAASHARRAHAGSGGHFAADFPDPGRSQLLKHAAQLWLGPVLQCGAFRSSGPAGYYVEGMLHQLRCCLASPVYEVRAAALKAFVRCLRALNDAHALAGSCTPASQVGGDGWRAGGASSDPAKTAPDLVAPSAGLAASASAGAHDAKLLRLALEIVSRAALLQRLVSEGLSALWDAVAQEHVHKVIRRALRALGLLHALAASEPTSSEAAGVGRPTLDAVLGGAPEALLGPLPAGMRGVQHTLGCPCCFSAPTRLSLQRALDHVLLVQRLLNGSRELEARCEALRCLGRALGGVFAAPRGSSAGGREGQSAPVLESLAAALSVIASCVQPWEPDDWRLAGIEALAASQLLQSGVAALAEGSAAAVTKSGLSLQGLALKGWRCVIAFLEDEDHGVRKAAAQLAQSVMELAAPDDLLSLLTAECAALEFGNVGDPAHGRDPTLGSVNVATKLVSRQPLCTEAVLRIVVRWLVHHYGSRERSTRQALLLHLCELVTGSSDARAATPVVVVAAAGGGGGSAAPARRLFDKESDNPHAEPVLVAQLASGALRTLRLEARDDEDDWCLLEPWCTAAVERLAAVAAAVKVSGVGPATQRGINDPPVFGCAYCALLLLWAATPARASSRPSHLQQALHTLQADAGVASSQLYPLLSTVAVLYDERLADCLAAGGPLLMI